MYISFHLHLTMQKKRAKSTEGMCVLPFLCFKTLHIRAPNPLDTNFISHTQKLFISAQNFPPRGMSTSHSGVLCKDLCDAFEQAGASAQPRTARSLPVGAMSSVHYLVQACPVFAVLFSLVHASLCKHLHPPTLIFRTKDIKLTVNLSQNLKFTYPSSLESLSSDPVFASDSAYPLCDQSKTLDWTHADVINIWM